MAEFRSAALLEAVAVIAGLDDVAAVREPIEERGGHLRIPEHAAPLPEGEVGGHDERDAFVELADQVEEQRSAVLGERQVAELIEDNDVLIEESCGEAAGFPFALLGIELVDEIDDAEEAGALALGDRMAAEGGSEVRLSGACAADEDDITSGIEVLPGVELADLGLADHRFPEVEAIEIPRDGEVRQAQLILVGACLAVGDLSREQLSQPMGRGELLLAQGRQALLQRTRHAAQAQRLQLFDQLGLHCSSPRAG